jgi:hypothetical protein
MQHKGEIVEKAIRQSGYPITYLAKKLKRSRRWMYHLFENANISLDLIIRIGEAIHYDFTEDIKDLKKYDFHPTNNVQEQSEIPVKKGSKDSEKWKNKYLDLLERHNKLLSQLKSTYKTTKPKKK